MHYLFHGEDTVQSRLQLRKVVQTYSSQGHEIREINAEKLTPPDLESLLSISNLFSRETLVIEGLYSRAKSKDKDLCLELLSNYQGDKNIIVWEKKELTKLTVGKLPKTWQISLSKLSAILFAFLDSIYPSNSAQSLKLFHELLTMHHEPIVIFAMLARHITNLLIAKSATSPKLPPWQLAKLKSQGRNWSESQLIHFHDELLRIDFQVKTGRSKLSYTDHIDLLLLNLLG